MRLMTVSVTLTLQVDRETWAATYGTGEDAAGVRADAKRYAVTQLADSAAAEAGAIIEVAQG